MHEYVAPRVIGRDPLEIDLLAADLVGYVGFRSSGAEVRGNSAFDIALWDLFGKAMGQPVAQLLGGFTRREIRTYNTCAGADYIKKATGQTTANYDLGGRARTTTTSTVSSTAPTNSRCRCWKRASPR